MLTSTFRRLAAGAAIAAAVAMPLPANAASWVIEATGNPNSVSPTGPNPLVYDLPLTITSVNGGAFSPFAISSFDDFTISVTLSSTLNVPAGALQVFGINFITNPDKTDFNPTPSTLTIAAMSINGGTPEISNCDNCLASLIVGFPGAARSVDDLFTFAVIQFAGDDPILEGLTLSYFIIDPASETPLPAALPLFASGLAAMGIIARRKRKKASERAAG